MSNNTIPIEMTTLTPVHIGSGEELHGNADYLYFQDEEKVAIVNSEKVLNLLESKGRDNLESINVWVEVIENEGDLMELITRHIPNLKASDISERLIDIYSIAPSHGKNIIKEQMHLAIDKPTLPGSSLKGSIRTALLSSIIDENPNFVMDNRNLEHPKRRGKFSDGQVIANYFGGERNRRGELTHSANKDWLRFLRISDFYFNENTCLVKSQVVNYQSRGWAEKRNESSYFECIPANATTLGSIQFPKKLIEVVEEKRYITEHLDKLDIIPLFEIINENTRYLVDKEIGFWEEEGTPLVIGNHLDVLNNIIEQLDNLSKNECIMRVGANSGWHFITGAWAEGTTENGDYYLDGNTWYDLKKNIQKGKSYPDDMPFPKTRKMIEDGMPMGFVKLSVKES